MHASPHPHAIHDERLIDRLFLFVPRFVSFRVSFLHFSSHFYLYSVLNLFFHVDNAKANIPTEESCSLAEFTPPTGYEPKLFDDFHYSETTEMIFQEESGDKDTVPSYLCDAELDDETIGKALSLPMFFQERD